jgi:hypothetical protein
VNVALNELLEANFAGSLGIHFVILGPNLAQQRRRELTVSVRKEEFNRASSWNGTQPSRSALDPTSVTQSVFGLKMGNSFSFTGQKISRYCREAADDAEAELSKHSGKTS